MEESNFLALNTPVVIMISCLNQHIKQPMSLHEQSVVSSMSVTIRKGSLLSPQHKCWPLYMSCLQVVMTPDFSVFSQCMTLRFSGDTTNSSFNGQCWGQKAYITLPDILQTKMTLCFGGIHQPVCMHTYQKITTFFSLIDKKKIINR